VHVLREDPTGLLQIPLIDASRVHDQHRDDEWVEVEVNDVVEDAHDPINANEEDKE